MRRLIMVAAAGLLSVVLSGCGEDKDAKPEATVTNPTTTAPETAPADASTNAEHPADAEHPAEAPAH